MVDSTNRDVRVLLRNPGAAPIPAALAPVQINGKSYRVILRIRDHGQQEWRTATAADRDLNTIAQRCTELFNNLKPTDKTDLKKISFTFEIGNSGFLGFFGRNKNLQLKQIDYVDSSSKKQTVEVTLDSYAPIDQQRLKRLIKPLFPITNQIFGANPQKRPTLHTPPSPAATTPAATINDDDTDEDELLNIDDSVSTTTPAVTSPFIIDDSSDDDEPTQTSNSYSKNGFLWPEVFQKTEDTKKSLIGNITDEDYLSCDEPSSEEEI